MLPTQNCDSDEYDFTKTENAERWRGVLVPSFKKVLDQVHRGMSVNDDALLYLETVCLRIMAMLVGKPLPHSVQDLEEKVRKTFPKQMCEFALNDSKDVVSKKRKTVLPTDRVHSLLQKDVLQYKIDISVTLFLVGVLEMISADILKLTGSYVQRIGNVEITREDIELIKNADNELLALVDQNNTKPVFVPSPLAALPAQRTSTTYEEVVKELIADEKLYHRDLLMLIRVFREKLLQIVKDAKELDPIFSNIMDIYELTVSLLGTLEDSIEMAQEHGAPYVGACLDELAEAAEFDVYTKYAQDVTSKESKDALATLLAKPEALSLMSAGHGFRDAVKYYLPKLLMVPVWHAFVYFEYIKMLIELSPLQEDLQCLKQVSGLLSPLRSCLEQIVSELSYDENASPTNGRLRRKLATERTRELQNSVEHWDDKDVGQNCLEFIREDSLSKLGSGKRQAERKVYLFDGLMVLCKPIIKRQVPSTGAPAYDYRLKEKFFMRKVEIIDRADTDELKNSFEIATKVQPPVILMARNAQHKNDWMADLIMVSTKTMLEQILDKIVEDLEKLHPLRIPSPDIYKFAEPDSSDNIVLEDRDSTGVPLIKGATLHKLIERLTYHIYADPKFVRTFLTTYRSFCTPQQLLELLICRFNIPDPSLVYPETDKDPLNCDTDKIHKSSQREDSKRYRKEYVQPVQFRVLNVLRHWVDHHFYDFQKDPTLLEKLKQFLDSVSVKSMRKWVDSVLKIVQRKNEQEKSHKQITFAYGHSPPPIESHLNVPDSEITLLTLHPLELARQMTLLEFELYKNVKPSELVGSPWTKKDKELKSPNLRKIMKHTTNVTLWIEKSIIEAENYEERVAMVTRAIEVMMVMLELNNFSGILSISSAMGSASVHRLKLTFQGLPARYEKFLEECSEMNDGHLKKYQERLRSINPPCVPFFGRYLTDILHLEEGNPDFLPNTELINFSKRRKVSEIIGEIQQYQNQPYCLMVDTKIRNFLENLDPFKGMSEPDISNFLYHESLRIEPRGCKQPLKFPRKWANVPLKSPGIKPRRQNNANNNSNTIGTMQSTLTFGIQRPHTHSICESTSGGGGGDQSPPGAHSQSNNSVFANVYIPERGSLQSAASMAISATASAAAATTLQACSVSATPTHKQTTTDDLHHHHQNHHHLQQQNHHYHHHQRHHHVCHQPQSGYQFDGSGDAVVQAVPPVPQLPKKPSGLSAQAHIWSGGGGGGESMAGFSPTLMDEPLDPGHGLPEADMHAHSHQQPVNNNQYSNDHQQTLPPSPLPRVVVSPRQDALLTGNRSPFHANTLPYSKTNSSPTMLSGSSNHFSPTDSIASAVTTCMSAGSGSCVSPQLIDIDTNNPAVPVSPHVNVPPHAPNVEHRSAPPPLPPRRKERTESCAEFAQKRQAPDAPQLPPRDGELSPPPIPPRLNQSIAGTLPRNTISQTMVAALATTMTCHEVMGGKRLLLPNTSSIMIRRNSAIEKRSQKKDQPSQSIDAHQGNPSSALSSTLSTSTPGISTTSSSTSSSSLLLLSSPIKTAGSTAMPIAGSVGGVGAVNHMNAPIVTPTSANDEQSVSPAASSSTASPRTPMTPISPHIPIAYRILENSSNSYQSPQPAQQQQQQKQIRPRPTTAMQGGHQQQQAHHHHHHHVHHQHHHQQQHQQHHQLHHHNNQPASGCHIPPPPRTSPHHQEFFPNTEGTPKLPPKPSLSGNIYNNSDKGTKFLYPSTNQE